MTKIHAYCMQNNGTLKSGFVFFENSNFMMLNIGITENSHILIKLSHFTFTTALQNNE